MMSLVGRLIGEYRLETLTGSGGIGEVLRARHIRTDRIAAVKVIHPRLTADPAFRERFRRETGAAATLHHPNIVEILNVGEHAGQYYIVMEYLGDGSVRTLLQRREAPLPFARRIDLVRQAADGLQFAHTHGVLHRDVKPENLLLRRESASGEGPPAYRVKVADFGLMRLAESGITLDANVVVGSPPYMSPEQCKGSPLDARSDIYSLGVVLYELATGYPPFQVKTIGDAVQKHLSVAPEPPRSVSAEVPAALEAIILRCLAKKPEERFATAGELSGALREVIGTLHEARAKPNLVWRDTTPAPPEDPGRIVIRPTGGEPEARTRLVPQPPPPPPPGARKKYDIVVDERLRPAHAAGAEATVAPPSAPFAPPGARPIVVTPPPEMQPAKRAPDQAAAGSKRIRVVLEKDTLTLTAGQPAVVQVTLANVGSIVDHFAVVAEGVPASWVIGPPEPPQLNPGERTVIALTVTAPRSPESRAADYPVVVRARSGVAPEESGTAEAKWTVLPFAASSLSIGPARKRAWKRAAYSVRVRNEGNAPGRYLLSGIDDEQAIRFHFSEEQLALEPGQTAQVKLRAEAPTRWIGSSESRSFTVRAEPLTTGATAPDMAQQQPQVMSGQFVHRPIVPIWLPPFAAMAAVAAFFIWLWLQGQKDIVVAVMPPNVQVPLGFSRKLNAAVTNRKNEAVPDRPVAWESSDTLVATVTDSGVVRGRREGSALITARVGRKRAAAEVTVVPASVDAVVLAPKRVSLRVGASAQLTARARDANGGALRRDFTWMSSDPTVATIGGDGRVTAKGPGSATITAQAEAKTATAEIVVAELPKPAGGEGGGGGPATCDEYNPAGLRVVNERELGFVVTDGSKNLLTLDNERDARKALAVATQYKKHCTLGTASTRPNRSDYIIEFWESPSPAPAAVIEGESCFTYDRAKLRTINEGARGFVLTDGKLRLLADTEEDAKFAWDVAQQHASMCSIGHGNTRPNRRDYIVQYWKK